MTTGTMLLYAGYGGFGITLLLLIIFLIFPPKRRDSTPVPTAGTESGAAYSEEKPTEPLEKKTEILHIDPGNRTGVTELLENNSFEREDKTEMFTNDSSRE